MEDKMVKIKIRYLVAKKQKGHVLYYWQPTKDLQAVGFLPRRLSDGNNNELEAIQEAQSLNAELDAWRAGEVEEISLKPGTVSWLIDQFQKDARFYELRPDTQSSYIKDFKHMDDWVGDLPFNKITRVSVRSFLDKFKDKKRTQKKVYSMGRMLYNYARDLGLATENPFEKHRITSNPPREQIWTNDEQKNFLANCARPSISLAMVIGADTGQRLTDILRMAWSQYDGQYIKLTQSKTGARVNIPVTIRLKALLDSQVKTSTQIVVSENNHKPYTVNHFSHLFKGFCDDAGVDRDKQFRDLRRTAVVNLALALNTVPEIASITGHKNAEATSIIETYLPKDIRLADSGILKLEKYRRNPSNLKKGS